MSSVTRVGAPFGGTIEHALERPHDPCRWCGGPAAWAWTAEGGPDLPGPDAGCAVCAACQDLTLAGDDAGLLDRHMTALTARVGYPVAEEFLREQGAGRLARWIVRRGPFRALDDGALR